MVTEIEVEEVVETTVEEEVEEETLVAVVEETGSLLLGMTCRLLWKEWDQTGVCCYI